MLGILSARTGIASQPHEVLRCFLLLRAGPRPTRGRLPSPGMVSVVIPTKDRPDSLEQLLASLRRQDYSPLEIIVVDDASEPHAVPGGGVRRAPGRESEGPPSRRTAAWRRPVANSSCSWTMTLNSSNRVRSAAPSPWPAAAPTPRSSAFARSMPTGRPMATNRPAWTCPAWPGVSAVAHAWGGPSRSCAVGGFPTMFDYYYEEIELVMRLLDADRSILFDPRLSVIHHFDPRGRDPARISAWACATPSMPRCCVTPSGGSRSSSSVTI